jgi:N-acetylgalactosamine-6-sulfatase
VPKYEWRFRHLTNREDQIYASVLSHADDRIGQVLAALDRLQLADNTLVIFSSDNGPARASDGTKLDLNYDTATGAGWGIAPSKGITGGRKGYKASLFEGGVGVPFIARWPGRIAAGKADEVSLISAVDLLPTFCEVAGVKLPAAYKPDGVSQVTTLLGKPYPQRESPLFWKFESPWPAPTNRPDHWVSYAIVDQRWKLVANKDSSHCELYDIGTDLGEGNDLKAKNPEVVKELLGKIADWQKTLPAKPDATCFSTKRGK